jgi:two-component system, chemotaxis family, sensor kinase CheA
MINEFHQQYVEEAKQVLKELEQSLLLLERNRESDELNNVYRNLHTLKGSAGMFGFHSVERLTHELESIYADVRDGIRNLDEGLMDLSLRAVDVLEDVIDGRENGDQINELIGLIKGGKTLGGETNITGEGSVLCHVIILTPETGIFKRGINFKSILDDIEAVGSTEIIVHDEFVPLETQLQKKEITSWFEIYLAASKTYDEVLEVFMFLKPEEYCVMEFNNGAVFDDVNYMSRVALNEYERTRRLQIVSRLLPESTTNPTPDSSFESVVPRSIDDEFQTVDLPMQNEFTRGRRKTAGSISVSTQKLDHLINIVSELVIYRSEIQHLLDDTKSLAVAEALEKLERLTVGLRDSAFSIRLVPLSTLNVKLTRLIRSVSRELNKDVEFITEGLETELDRSMIAALEAPLMHMIRNAMDHGIESPEDRLKRNKPTKGLIKLYSYNSGDHVFIQLQDDGNGIDFDKIREKGIAKGMLSRGQQYSEQELVNVMMSPGFSTADKVSTVSGRGVGMDVVKKEIAALRGDIEVSTEKGLGSIFTLRLPLTLTVLDTLVVSVDSGKYLLPINEVEHCFKQDHQSLFFKKSRQINHHGQLIPFVSLREHFNIREFPTEETVIVIRKNDRRIAVVVDKIVGTLQTVYKPLNELLYDVDCFSGASILGDGSMALIINALRLKN